MTHNEYTNKYKEEIKRLNKKMDTQDFLEYFNKRFRFHFLERIIKEEALRADFMKQYEDRELSDSYVTESGELVL